MHKPNLAGVPTWLTDYWLAMLKAGRMESYDQREMHKALLHKWSGKPGAPALTCTKSARQLNASFLELRVRNEIRRMKAAGKPPRGGYRPQALDTVAEVTGWKEGEALERWLRRNRGR